MQHYDRSNLPGNSDQLLSDLLNLRSFLSSRSNWKKGEFEAKDGSRCLMGAVQTVATGLRHSDMPLGALIFNWRTHRMVNALYATGKARWAKELWSWKARVLLSVLCSLVPLPKFWALSSYNDHNYVGHADILALIDCAIQQRHCQLNNPSRLKTLVGA